MDAEAKINPATPLGGLRCLVIDTETTGLRVDRDRVISLGAVPLTGSEIEPAGELSTLINPGVPIPAASTKIHGLNDNDVASACAFAEFAPTLKAACAGRVVVGHNIGFDLALLAREHERAGLDWRAPHALDTGMLARAVNPHLPDTSMETVADWLDVEITDRHTALGDARATAQIYRSLLPKLSRAGIRTFAEAERAMIEYNNELARGHAAAGWQVPEIAGGAARPAMDTFIFRHRLADVMSSPPIFIGADATIADAAAKMTAAKISAILIGDPADLVGIATERDIVGKLAAAGSEALSLPISEAMSSPVITLPADSPIYRAVARLQRQGIRHVPTTDRAGHIAGVVSARDLLRRSANAALVLGDALATAETTAELAQAFAQLPQAAERLRAEELGPTRIARVISDEVRALTARAAELAERTSGPAPADWSLMVLGSAGRGESLLVPDQDNALIFEDVPGMAEWAATFGETVNDILDAAGLPFCKGGVMAGRPEWCKSPRQWRETVAGWIDHARPQDLLNVDIFFDLYPVAGTAELSERLHDDALAMAQRAPAFIRALNMSIAQLDTPVGLFSRLRTTQGRIDIKASGLLPIIAFARAAALQGGIAARSTPERLAAAAERGAVPQGDVRRLIDMHADFVALAMDQQISDIAAGLTPSYRIEVRRLDRDRRRALAAQLSSLRGILSLAWSTLSG